MDIFFINALDDDLAFWRDFIVASGARPLPIYDFRAGSENVPNSCELGRFEAALADVDGVDQLELRSRSRGYAASSRR